MFRKLSFVLLLAGCATAPSLPSDSRPAVLSIHNMACRDCGDEVEKLALAQPGVRAAHFDPEKVELHLELAPLADPAQVAGAIRGQELDGEKLDASVGAGTGAYTAFKPLDPSWDAKIVSKAGEDVPELAPVLGSGKVTVVDFYADWCGPCHALDDHLHELLGKGAPIAYRRFNMVSWDTPLAKHYLADAKELPLAIVFDRSGREVSRISGLHVDALDAAIAAASR